MNIGLARSVIDLSSRWRSHFARLTAGRVDQKRQSGSDHLQRGTRGEKLACGSLRWLGYKIPYRNVRARHGGEVDILCRDGDTLVCIAVKSRRRDDLVRPS